jgi:hypothetical protein
MPALAESTLFMADHRGNVNSTSGYRQRKSPGKHTTKFAMEASQPNLTNMPFITPEMPAAVRLRANANAQR